jgi:hypothetical protein
MNTAEQMLLFRAGSPTPGTQQVLISGSVVALVTILCPTLLLPPVTREI